MLSNVPKVIPLGDSRSGIRTQAVGPLWGFPCLAQCPLRPLEGTGPTWFWFLLVLLCPRGPEFWQEQLSPGPGAALLIGCLLAGYMNDQRHGGGGQVSERELGGQGGGPVPVQGGLARAGGSQCLPLTTPQAAYISGRTSRFSEET